MVRRVANSRSPITCQRKDNSMATKKATKVKTDPEATKLFDNDKCKCESAPTQDYLQKLQDNFDKRFPVDQVQQRDGGFGKKLDYIPIDKVYNRMNSLLPVGYNWIIKDFVFQGDSVIVIGRIEIPVNGKVITRDGIGSDKLGKDVDKAVKTAMAEAFKKATHTLGIGLYLWEQSERDNLVKERVEQKAKDSTSYSKEQLENMKNIRSTLSLSTDELLDRLVKEYPNIDINAKSDLKPSNIDGFITWAYENKLEQEMPV